MEPQIDVSDAKLELYRRDPLEFFENLVIDSSDRGLVRLGDVWDDVQVADFKAMTPLLQWYTGVLSEKPPVRQFFIQRGRGRSKTTDIAAAVLYVLFFSPKTIDGMIAAADKDQANLMILQASKVLECNPFLLQRLTLQRKRVANEKTKSQIVSHSSDVASSWGLTSDLIVCDEFSHWQTNKEDFWTSVYTTYLKRSGGLFICTNAGWGQNFQWNVKQLAIDSDSWYHHAPLGPAGWYTEEMLTQQRKAMTKSQYERAIENIWQLDANDLITLEMCENCINSDLSYADYAYAERGLGYIVTFDLGLTHDRTVGCVMHYDTRTKKIVIDRMDVIDPEVNKLDTPVLWAEEWIREIDHLFGQQGNTMRYLIDSYQMQWLIERLLLENFDIFPIKPTAVYNRQMSELMVQIIGTQRIEWYPGCGQIYDSNGILYQKHDERDDLCSELSQLEVVERSGSWKFDHSPHRHNDRYTAVGMGAHHLLLECLDLGSDFGIVPGKQGHFNI